MRPINSVSVQDFQSIQKLDLDFGDFTVLVGPSSSGKSAFLRAVRACLRNTFVPANVRAGSTKTVITVNLTHAEPVTIERGKSLSTYVLGSEKYTKSARTVPEPVAKAIGMPLVEGSDLNFSFQFDRPFLLAETGSQAAQVVGSLTNVTLLHEAVREANRRRSEANQQLKMRKSDEARYVEQAQEYADLPQEQALITSVEEDLNDIEHLQNELDRLRQSTSHIRQLEDELDNFELPPEPVESDQEIQHLAEAAQSLESLRSLTDSVRTRAEEVRKSVTLAKSLEKQVQNHEEEYQRVLHEMGVCPTCGRGF